MARERVDPFRSTGDLPGAGQPGAGHSGSAEPETLRYRSVDRYGRPVPEVLGEADAGRRRPLDGFQKALTWAILLLCLAVWAVVGFVLWLPLMLRSVLRFSFALSQGMLQGAEPRAAGRILRETVEFYRRGFAVAIDAVFAEPEGGKTPPPPRLSTYRLLREVVWAALFWYLVLYLTGVVQASPAELVRALVDFPWVETARSLVDAVTGLFTSATPAEGSA
ncbi:MAG: hypothetical protein RQ751_12790 [Longimicrobiales bacterium]|nr:hypothetical protein [Longimicrobiales bacterium]